MKHLALLTMTLWPVSALAGPGEGWHDGYGYMMGGGFGILGGLMMLVFWGVVIALIVMAVRWFSASNAGPGQNNALDTLRERFAAGEIDEEEFKKRKRVLEG